MRPCLSSHLYTRDGEGKCFTRMSLSKRKQPFRHRFGGRCLLDRVLSFALQSPAQRPPRLFHTHQYFTTYTHVHTYLPVCRGEFSLTRMISFVYGGKGAVVLSGQLRDSVLIPFAPDYSNRVISERKMGNWDRYKLVRTMQYIQTGVYNAIYSNWCV